MTIEQAAHQALITAWVRRKNYRARLKSAGVDTITALHTPDEKVAATARGDEGKTVAADVRAGENGRLENG